MVEATRKAGRVATATLRRSRLVLGALATLFMLSVLTLVALTIVVDISYYILTVAIDMLAALLIALAFQ